MSMHDTAHNKAVVVPGDTIAKIDRLKIHYGTANRSQTIRHIVDMAYATLPASVIRGDANIVQLPGLEKIATGRHILTIELEPEIARKFGHLQALTLTDSDQSLVNHLIELAHRALISKHHRLRRTTAKEL